MLPQDSSLVAQMVKHPPAMQETRVQFLGQKDPLEKKMATHSSIPAWRIPRTEQPGGLQTMGSQRVRHDWAANTFFQTNKKVFLKLQAVWFHFYNILQFGSVQFSLSAMFNSLWPCGLQHSKLPCPSPTPGAYSSSYPLSRWCHPTISSSVVPFSSRLQSFPASGSFPVSQLFASGSQNIGVSASVISPSSEHPGLISFRMDWLDLFAV